MARRRGRRAQQMPPVPGDPFRESTVVSFTMDHGYDFPVVSAPGKPPPWEDARFGLSPELVDRLIDWAGRWESLAMRQVMREPSSDASRRDDAQLVRDQWALADALRRELPEDVELWVSGVPFDEWRAEQRRR